MEIQGNTSANFTTEQKIANEQAEAKLKLIGGLMEKELIRLVKSDGDIMYTEYFYSQMNKLMDEGKTAAAAYEELGFAIDVFGLNRAEQAGKNARIRARNQAGYRFTAPGGAVSLSEVEDFASLPPEVNVPKDKSAEFRRTDLSDPEGQVHSILTNESTESTEF